MHIIASWILATVLYHWSTYEAQHFRHFQLWFTEIKLNFEFVTGNTHNRGLIIYMFIWTCRPTTAKLFTRTPSWHRISLCLDRSPVMTRCTWTSPVITVSQTLRHWASDLDTGMRCVQSFPLKNKTFEFFSENRRL